VRPVLVAGVQCFLDQQAAKTGAVDEQITLELFTALQGHSLDEAVLGAQLHLDDPALDSLHAARLGIAAQILRIQSGVEVIGVRDGGEG
jgi:hypothetical protein